MNDHSAIIARSCRTLEAAETEPSLEALASAAGMSPSHFQRVFKAQVGVSPKVYAATRRAERLKQALGAPGAATVTDALYLAGYGAPSRAYAAAAAHLGMTPTAWRKGGAGVAIRYALTECSLGRLLVAGTARGLCLIAFDDNDAVLRKELGARFPRAEIAPAGGAFDAWLDLLLQFIETPAAAFGLPLDIQGTAFQCRVWDALRKIPAGTTITYAELARRLGQPTAARAVASACGANKVAVAIPCHRVIGRDGKLTGYRWGIERKRALLAREKTAGPA